MFGKKKALLPEGIRLMHYVGLPGFAQDAPCFMEQTAEALVFRRVEGSSVTLPLAKVDSLDIIEAHQLAVFFELDDTAHSFVAQGGCGHRSDFLL